MGSFIGKVELKKQKAILIRSLRKIISNVDANQDMGKIIETINTPGLRLNTTNECFSKPTKVPNQWLIHFTNEDPAEIIKTGYRGWIINFLGATAPFSQEDRKWYERVSKLSKQDQKKELQTLDPEYVEEYYQWLSMEKKRTGDYGFAYLLGKDIDNLQSFYGKNAIIFKAKSAIRAWHSDGMWEVIFNTKTTYAQNLMYEKNDFYQVINTQTDTTKDFENNEIKELINWLDEEH